MLLTLNFVEQKLYTSDYVNKLYIRIYRECALAFVFIENHFHMLFKKIPTLNINGSPYCR